MRAATDSLLPAPDFRRSPVDSSYPARGAGAGAGAMAEFSSPCRFQVVGTLGHGGMADIYLAMPRDGALRPVAIKRLRDPERRRPAIVELFTHEVRMSALLNHPNIVGHVGVGESDGAPFLVMEYLAGKPLASLWSAHAASRGPLEPAVAAYIAIMVLRALQHAHELTDASGTPLGLVHCDVCPRNVMIGYDGSVKLLDFGIAKSRVSPRAVDSGVIKGKPNYMAPEQARATYADRRSDVFSAGVILWELLTGERFSGKAAPQGRRYRLPYAPAPPVRSIRPEVHGDLDALVAQAMAVRPSDRFQSAKAMCAALLEFLWDSNAIPGQSEIAQLMAQMFPGGEAEAAYRVGSMLSEQSHRHAVITAVAAAGGASAEGPAFGRAFHASEGAFGQTDEDLIPVELCSPDEADRS